jgi:PIN domain nuclease of toxin-antitoxin system
VRCVLDASALLAYLLDEPGKDIVLSAILDDSVMSTVNFAEVVTRYARDGAAPATVADLRRQLPVPLIPLDAELAEAAGLLYPVASQAGLSLGDRCCLALAAQLGLPALTADRAWTRVAGQVSARVELVR